WSSDVCSSDLAFVVQPSPEWITDRQPLLAPQRQADAQAGQGRAQLMGDIAHQLVLTVEQALHPNAHALEAAGQFADFIAALADVAQGLVIKATLGQVLGGNAQFAQWAGQITAEQQ